MANINFVPDDYIQNNESNRTNIMYLVLLLVVMAALGGSFVTIKIRQHAIRAKEQLVNAKLARAQQAIAQFEQLQAKRAAMMKTALTTAELLEAVPKSVLLASLTNNLPVGVSLLELKLLQKQPQQHRTATAATTKYKQAKAAKDNQPAVSPEKLLETHIDIEGLAPSDRQVAAYIEALDSSSLLDKVSLVESKEYKIDDTVFRRFKLKAMLAKQIELTKAEIEKIRARAMKHTRTF